MASSAKEVPAHGPESSPISLHPGLRPKRRNRARNTPKNLSRFASKETSEETESEGWSLLPVDVQSMILSKLSYKQLFQAKVISKCFNAHINSDGFLRYRVAVHPQEGMLTALHFSVVEHGGKYALWQCSGYDLTSNSWKKLPPFQLPLCLYPKLYKNHLICGAGGMFCISISTFSPGRDKIIVFNPLTGKRKELPRLNHPRNPVLMHMVMDPAGGFYKIIVAGSTMLGQEHLSKFTEVFDSRTSTWTTAQVLPGPQCCLNEYQVGVYRNGILYCIAFLEEKDAGRGVLAFSVDEGKWLPHLACPLPNATLVLNVVQLVDINGEVVLFSEVEHSSQTFNQERRIDILEEVISNTSSGQRRGKWRNVMLDRSKSWKSAHIYLCVPFEKEKFCIFNSSENTGVVCDLYSGKHIQSLCPPTWRDSVGMTCYSKNPLTFTFQASFGGNPFNQASTSN
ncbi:hypothetical protein M758_3G242700 [Ceratodon purpureus]|nr:hypothetical protein M758_3G242700 [Ceratodon purpureus]